MRMCCPACNLEDIAESATDVNIYNCDLHISRHITYTERYDNDLQIYEYKNRHYDKLTKIPIRATD